MIEESSDGPARAGARDHTPLQVLDAAKAHRTTTSVLVAEAAIRTAADVLDSKACDGKVAVIGQARTAAVVSARPADVLRLDGELRSAEVDSEIAAARVEASTARHAAAVAELYEADDRVREAESAVFAAGLLDLASEFTAALDVALALGAELQRLTMHDALHTPMNRALPSIPVAVLAALDRLPRASPLHTPMHVLRGGIAWRMT